MLGTTFMLSSDEHRQLQVAGLEKREGKIAFSLLPFSILAQIHQSRAAVSSAHTLQVPPPTTWDSFMPSFGAVLSWKCSLSVSCVLFLERDHKQPLRKHPFTSPICQTRYGALTDFLCSLLFLPCPNPGKRCTNIYTFILKPPHNPKLTPYWLILSKNKTLFHAEGVLHRQLCNHCCLWTNAPKTNQRTKDKHKVELLPQKQRASSGENLHKKE